MSRFGLEEDDREFDDRQPNATCTDCGVDYARGDGDAGTWCDTCSDQRDSWVSALEVRMAQAGVPTVLTRLPTLSAVAASRAGKPLPKKASRKAVA